MAATDRTNNALQVIFSFFLGLMVLAFIGIGVNTFYPSPSSQYQKELQSLYRAQERFNIKEMPGDQLTDAEKAERERIQVRINSLQQKQEEAMPAWARTTSIVLIVFATLMMTISLIRSDQLRVISNGLLLGGLFTMVYGVGWVIFSGESTARFVVIVFAFAATIALGYLKFVHGRAAAPVPASAGAGVQAGGAPELSALEARISALESRTAAAAVLLSGEKSDR